MRSLSKTVFVTFAVALLWWAAPVDGQPADRKIKVPDKKALDEAAIIVNDVFEGDFKQVQQAEMFARSWPAQIKKLSIERAVAELQKKTLDAKKLTNELEKAKAKAEEARNLADDLSKKLLVNLLANARASFDDPANRYVLYSRLIRVASFVNNTELALQTVDEMANGFGQVPGFDIDALEFKSDVVELAVNQPGLSSDSIKFLIDLATDLQAQAVEKDKYGLANELGRIALRATLAVKDEKERKKLEDGVAKINGEVKAKQAEFKRIQAFIDRLEANPKDAEANLELGKYYALVKVKWDKALPYLAKGGDVPLAKLAADDLAEDLAKSKDAHKELALADRYWELVQEAVKKQEAASKKDRSDEPFRIRAKQWYVLARDGLTGLNQTKAQRRIDDIDLVLIKRTELPLGPVGELRKMMGHTEEVKCVAFSPEGRFAVSGSSDKTVRVWELASGREEKELKGHEKLVWSVAFHLTQRQVLSSSWDTTVRLWDVATGKEIRKFKHDKDVNGLALSRDGGTMLTASDDHLVYLWNVQTGEQIRRYGGHTNYVYCVAFSPDGRYFASGGVDKTVRVCEVDTGALVRVFEGHLNSVTNVAFSPDGRMVYSCGDGAAHLWDVSTGKEVRRFEHNKSGNVTNVLALALSSDGRRLYTGGDDKAVHIWDTASAKELMFFEGHTDSITSLAVSADGNRLLSGSLDRSVRLWGLPR